jgi:hypothetical protein
VRIGVYVLICEQVPVCTNVCTERMYKI